MPNAALRLAAALLLGLAVIAPARAEPIHVEHAQGVTELAAPPKTVATFDLASLDTLDALGIPVAGVPVIAMPASLAQYADAATPKIGSLFEPDFEAVNALQPDLVIVASRSAPQYEALSRIAPVIDLTLDPADTIGSAERNIRTLARLFGKDEEAEAKLARLDGSIEALRAETAKAGTGLIVMATGNRLSAYGPGSRFGVLHSEFGVAPADPKLASAIHGEAVSNEYILETDPDWLFVIDRDAAIGQGSAAALLDNELVRRTKAWQKGQVVQLDSANWYLVGGGLSALQASVDQLAAAMAGKPAN
ncbi:siderophore ABC transporter substrate-binding protein [Aureimonas pseudogalii]|uniref:Iron complex transport system substrate-binding protein n=1 Tax=Aureimonas pseudogalii TaxID=1744844 RepID=A0A7W6H6M1_9HYPH|nr:siderophore ABC transporter substrate-binding protein [Aureimonas pseudogalii]MBB3999564.1 iron complex transport system substrate-binding protein [Aureimonas pseudogalii]